MRLAVLLALVLLTVEAADAQEASPASQETAARENTVQDSATPEATPRAVPESLPDVLRDHDADRIPDRQGETVFIAGRATMDAGALGDPHSVAITSAGRAVWVHLPEATSIEAGDSLHVLGSLGFWNGMALVGASSVRRVGGSKAVPPVHVVASGDLERLEGQLVRLRGTVTSLTEVANGGHAMMLALDDQSLVTAFIFRTHPLELNFGGFNIGDHVQVTGLAGQYDRVEPYSDTYQIYPRTAADIRGGGISPRTYRWVAAGTAGLLLAALAWAWLLRSEIRRRVSDLKRSEAYYRALVRSASEAVFVCDILGHGIEANPAARRAFGIGPEAPLPSLLDVVSAEYRDQAKDHLETLRTQGAARCDLGLVARGHDDSQEHDGSQETAKERVRLYEFESHVLDVEGDLRVLSLGRDVDAHRAHEAELVLAREEAEKMVRLKSALLASMSHEIRTPLTAVIGFAEVLHDEVDPEQKDLAMIIQEGGRRLLRTLNSVLDLARLDSGNEALSPRPLDLVDHIRQSVALVRSLAEEKELALEFESETEQMPSVCDAGALDRIVTNLVGNAIKFTDVGGVHIRLRAEDDVAVLTVSDTGIGIDEAFLPDLFSEFRQESEGDGRAHEGTGLGLAITQRLIHMMEGTIAVESQKGVGTTFTARWPRVPSELAAGDGAFTPEAAHAVAAFDAVQANAAEA